MRSLFATLGCVGLVLSGCTDLPSDTPSANGNGTSEAETHEKTNMSDEGSAEDQSRDDGASTTGTDVKREIGEAIDATTEFAAQSKDEYVQAMQKRLDQLDRKIATLEQKSADLATTAQAEWEERSDALKRKRKAAGERLDELKSSSQDAWKDLQSGVDDAWAELSAAFEEAAAKFE